MSVHLYIESEVPLNTFTEEVLRTVREEAGSKEKHSPGHEVRTSGQQGQEIDHKKNTETHAKRSK